MSFEQMYEVVIDGVKKGVLKVNWSVYMKVLSAFLTGMIPLGTMAGCSSVEPIEKPGIHQSINKYSNKNLSLEEKIYFIDCVMYKLEENYDNTGNTLSQSLLIELNDIYKKMINQQEIINSLEGRMFPKNHKENVEGLVEEMLLKIERRTNWKLGKDFVKNNIISTVETIDEMIENKEYFIYCVQNYLSDVKENVLSVQLFEMSKLVGDLKYDLNENPYNKFLTEEEIYEKKKVILNHLDSMILKIEDSRLVDFKYGKDFLNDKKISK